MTVQRSLAMLGTIACCVVLPVAPTVRGASDPADYPVDRIPMLLEVEMDAQRYFVGENFPITLRIRNPNMYDVHLGGFAFGPLEPHMAIAFPEGIVFPGEEEFFDISLGGIIDAIGGAPVVVPARGHIEHRRLVYCGTKLDMGHWILMPAGVYRVRMKCSIGAVTPNEPRRYTQVDWATQELHFTLIAPTGRDSLALDVLREKGKDLAEHERNPEPGFRSVSFQLGMYIPFLERFPDTVYGPEIRWEVAKLLLDELGNNRIPEQDVPRMVELWDQCMTFCLERGGAYGEEFIGWDPDKGPNHAVELARKYKRFDLLKRIVEKIDLQYPQDEDGALYRRVMLLSEAGAFEEARKVCATLSERFPSSRYVRSARSLVDWLEKQRKPE